MISCPDCGSDRVVAWEDVYGADSEILYCHCQDCTKGFDVRPTWEGVKLWPALYEPRERGPVA